MAEIILRNYPELKPFVLGDVQCTGTTLGSGAYGTVREVSVGAAAKTVLDLRRTETTDAKISEAQTQFLKECQLISTLRHPNIVQFLGISFFPDSQLPALVMERLVTSLHDLLDPNHPSPCGGLSPLPLFSIELKCSVLYDIASGLKYLHERSPPIVHRDLSAKNVLLSSDMVAKIADLGVARLLPRVRGALTMTKDPGSRVYMPPEASASTADDKKSKYDASIDIFSLGILTIFTISEIFPCDPLPSTYIEDQTKNLVPRTEIDRRSEYMRAVQDKLRASDQQHPKDHPLVQLIKQCLQNDPADRPGIQEVLGQIKKARVGFDGEDSERKKQNLVKSLQIKPRKEVAVIIHCHNYTPITSITRWGKIICMLNMPGPWTIHLK